MNENLKTVIFKTQQAIAIISLIIGVLAITINLVLQVPTYSRSFNIISILLITLILSSTFFINVKAARIVQVVFFISIGILTLFFEKELAFVGDMLILIGILLLYWYRCVKKFKFYHAFFLYVIIIGIKFASAFLLRINNISDDMVVTIATILTPTAFSIIFISTVLFLVKDRIQTYIEATQLNDSLYRIGINAHSALQDLNFTPVASRIYKLFSDSKLKSFDQKVVKRILDIGDFVQFKDNFRSKLLEAVKFNKTTEVLRLDIGHSIETILTVNKMDAQIPENINLFTDIEEDVHIRAVPFEIYFMLQNLFTQLLETMMKGEGKKALSIFCKRENGKAAITIFSSGPGFKHIPDPKPKLFDFTPTWCRGDGFMRLASARDIILYYHGSIMYSHSTDGGNQIVIKLPLFKPQPGDDECLRKSLSTLL